MFKLTPDGWIDAGHYEADAYGLLPYFGENVAAGSFGVVVGATRDKATTSGNGGVFLLPLP